MPVPTDLLKRLPFLTVFFALGLLAQGQAPPSDNKVPPETEPGIPVTDAITKERCSGCHKADDKGNLTRISWIRTTPEGWEEAIKRMVRLNGLSVSPEDAKHILAYLAQDHGLAPEEAAPYRWYLEMRQIYSEPTPSPEVHIACASCHSFARPETWHRSPTEWKLLVNMHIGYFPVSENNSFHARPRPDGYGVLPASLNTPRGNSSQPTHYVVDDALDYLNKNNPLHTAAWSNWRASLSDPNLKGRWNVSASLAGKGKYFGSMTLTPGTSTNSFTYTADLVREADGSKLSLSGQSMIYTGYEWRARGQATGIGAMRQVMTVSPDQSTLEGRWFWGGYQEFGFNVTAHRATSDPVVLGTNLSSIHAGSQNVALKIIGDNFPAELQISDIDLGTGVHVKSITSVKTKEISLLADVDPKIISGFRSVAVKSRTTPNVYAVYDKIDYIKISDESALARLGGNSHPKGYVQFEAVGYNRGLDGLPNTADDINLGPIQVKWSMEEFISHFGDNDREFVGSIDANGLFTPAAEGPNPQRKFTTNNTGDVWVVAKYQDKDSEGNPLTAKSYLIVTVPLYMKWDEPEVAQ
jgi:quinohemoprotein amine dehydrogenase